MQFARVGALVLLGLQILSLLFALLTIHLEGKMRVQQMQERITQRNNSLREPLAPSNPPSHAPHPHAASSAA